jgi:hypothetical protein
MAKRGDNKAAKQRRQERRRGTSMSVPATTVGPVTAPDELEWQGDATVTGTPLTLKELAGIPESSGEQSAAPDPRSGAAVALLAV